MGGRGGKEKGKEQGEKRGGKKSQPKIKIIPAYRAGMFIM